MLPLPSSALRACTVLALAGGLILSHIAFAAAASPGRATVASNIGQVRMAVAETTGTVRPHEELAENCYTELVHEKTLRGRSVIRRVLECD